MMVENDDTWQYCINCISWSNWSYIFDIMWFRDVRMHVTIVFLLKSVLKTTKLWMWKDVNSMAFLCEDTNPTNLFLLSFESSSNNLLENFQLGDFWIAFLIASLRIDEWWISSQNHNFLQICVQLSNQLIQYHQEAKIAHFGLERWQYWYWSFCLDNQCKKGLFCYQFATTSHSLLS